MTRSSIEPLYNLDPELELTLRRLRKTTKTVVDNSSSSSSIIQSSQFSTNISLFSFSDFTKPGLMENNDRTLKELATPDVVRRPPQALEEIPCGFLHNEVARDTGGLHQNEGVPIIPGWSSKRLVVLHPVLFNTWGDMKRMFLEKFFPASRTTTIRKEICGIREIQQALCHLSTPSDKQIVTDPILL
ncbi:hypothetical protein CR513_49131, partial [Mucuna pruriens]